MWDYHFFNEFIKNAKLNLLTFSEECFLSLENKLIIKTHWDTDTKLCLFFWQTNSDTKFFGVQYVILLLANFNVI